MNASRVVAVVLFLSAEICFAGAKVRTDFNPTGGLAGGDNFQASQPRGSSNRVLEVTVGSNGMAKFATAKQAAAFGLLADQDALPSSGTYAYMDADPACVTSKPTGVTNCTSITMPSTYEDAKNITMPSGTAMYYYTVVGLYGSCPSFDEYNPTSGGWTGVAAGSAVSGAFANTTICTHYFLQDKVSAQDTAKMDLPKVGVKCVGMPYSNMCP